MAPPHCEMKDIGQLGTADADADLISKRSIFSAEELLAKAEEEHAQATALACLRRSELLRSAAPDGYPLQALILAICRSDTFTQRATR